MAEDRFGEIKINSDSSFEPKGRDVPLASTGDTGEEFSPQQLDIPAIDSKSQNKRHRQQRSPQYRITGPSRKTIIWLSVIPLLVVLYGVSSYFFVPMLIKTILVPKLSKFVERPVEIDRIIYSPFNLELFVDDVFIGPATGDKTGKELLILQTARFKFSLGKIFDGKIWCRQAEIDGVLVNVTRHKDTQVEMNNIYDFFQSYSSGQNNRYWPSWLFLDEFKISSGKVHIDDRSAKKVFTIEQIQFYLPSPETREHDNTALPKLSAVIDSSPFEINAVRFQNLSGAWRTGFSFEFNNIIMDKFNELLPLPETGLLLSEGEADINLNIILPEKQLGSEGVVIEGEANLRKVKWQDADELVKLTLPEGKIVYHIEPSDKLIRFTNVDFQEPELSLSGKRDALDSLAYLHSIIEKVISADDVLEVESFLWNNGKINTSSKNSKGKKTEWNDVNLSMRNISTAGFRRLRSSKNDPALFTLRASDISKKPVAELFTEGQLNLETVLKGRLEITGLDLSRYPTLLPKSAFGLQKGISTLSFDYEYAGHPSQKNGNVVNRNKIYGGTLKTNGYVLTNNRNKAIAGDMMQCSKFHLDISSKTIVCDQLEILKSDIHPNMIFGKKVAKQAVATDNWHFLINDLQVNNSTIRTSMKGVAADKKNTNLVLRGVNIEGRSLQAEKIANNVKASLQIGKKGKLNLSGSYSLRTHQGIMELDVQDIELSLLRPYFSSWFIPKINSGMFGAKGTLIIPNRDFTGTMRIKDFDAGEGNGARISWRQAFSDNCIYKSTPFVFEMGRVVVQQPLINPGLSSGEKPISKYLQLKEDTLPASVRVGSIRVVDGSYGLLEPILYSGYQPQLQNINGTLSFADGLSQDFSITGKINGQSNFSLIGKGLMSKVLSYRLNVQDFSLLPFDSVLKKNAGFSGKDAIASWNQDMASDNKVSTIATKITVHDVVLNHDNSLAPILSLIIQDDHRFEMEMEGQYSEDKSQPFLFQQLINKLRHLEVKAKISPNLVLKSELSDFDLVPHVTFAPGSTILEESAALSLSSYKELLKMRPFLMVSLQGQYDPVADREVLQAELQKEADKQRDVENKRRALEKIKILQQEKRRLKELKAGEPKVITEEITPSELTMDLQPLPRKQVQLDISKLEDLARQRIESLQGYLVNQLQLDSSRIMRDSKVIEGAASVRIGIIPYIPPKAEKNDDE